MEAALFWIFAGASTVYVLHIGFYLVGANFYDIWQYRRLFKLQKKLEFETAPNPLVTVLIPAHNEEKVIEYCLESVRRNTYKNIQIVAINDASTDNTLKILRRYKRKHGELNMTVASTRKNVGKGGALNYALRRFAKGELVMTLDADSMIAPRAIANAVSYFDNPRVAGVAANVRVIDDGSLLAMLQKLEHMIGYRSKKVYSLTNCEFVIGGVASTYRMSVLKKVDFYDTDILTEDIALSIKIASHGNREHRLVYAADVEAITEGVHTYAALFKQRYRWKYGSLQCLVKHRRLIGRPRQDCTPSLTIYRLPTAALSEVILLATPLIWIFVAIVTASGRSPLLIFGAYCTITLYVMITLWFDEHTSQRNRFMLSPHALYAYVIFYIMDIVQLVSVSRCALKVKSLITQKHTESVWTSPARSDQGGRID